MAAGETCDGVQHTRIWPMNIYMESKANQRARAPPILPTMCIDFSTNTRNSWWGHNMQSTTIRTIHLFHIFGIFDLKGWYAGFRCYILINKHQPTNKHALTDKMVRHLINSIHGLQNGRRARLSSFVSTRVDVFNWPERRDKTLDDTHSYPSIHPSRTTRRPRTGRKRVNCDGTTLVKLMVRRRLKDRHRDSMRPLSQHSEATRWLGRWRWRSSLLWCVDLSSNREHNHPKNRTAYNTRSLLLRVLCTLHTTTTSTTTTPVLYWWCRKLTNTNSASEHDFLKQQLTICMYMLHGVRSRGTTNRTRLNRVTWAMHTQCLAECQKPSSANAHTHTRLPLIISAVHLFVHARWLCVCVVYIYIC